VARQPETAGAHWSVSALLHAQGRASCGTASCARSASGWPRGRGSKSACTCMACDRLGACPGTGRDVTERNRAAPWASVAAHDERLPPGNLPSRGVLLQRNRSSKQPSASSASRRAAHVFQHYDLGAPRQARPATGVRGCSAEPARGGPAAGTPASMMKLANLRLSAGRRAQFRARSVLQSPGGTV
jgi:hypothetical protein